jgi:hypothetical protein
MLSHGVCNTLLLLLSLLLQLRAVEPNCAAVPSGDILGAVEAKLARLDLQPETDKKAREREEAQKAFTFTCAEGIHHCARRGPGYQKRSRSRAAERPFLIFGAAALGRPCALTQPLQCCACVPRTKC